MQILLENLNLYVHHNIFFVWQSQSYAYTTGSAKHIKGILLTPFLFYFFDTLILKRFQQRY